MTLPDIIHIHHYYCGAMVLLGKMGIRKRMIQTVHAPIPRSGLLPHLVGSKIVYVSEATRLHDKALYPGSYDRMLVIRNGVDISGGLAILKNTSSASIREDRRIVVGYVGRFVREKGIFSLLDSLGSPEIRPNVLLRLAGDGTERREYIDRIDRAGIEYLYHGVVRDTLPLMAGCDIIVVPSLSDEAMPTVIMEAGLAHCAVLATSTDGVPEIVTHEHSGLLVPPGDVTAMTGALRRLIDDTSLRFKLADALHNRVRREYDIHRTGAELLGLYQSCQ